MIGEMQETLTDISRVNEVRKILNTTLISKKSIMSFDVHLHYYPTSTVVHYAVLKWAIDLMFCVVFMWAMIPNAAEGQHLPHLLCYLCCRLTCHMYTLNQYTSYAGAVHAFVLHSVNRMSLVYIIIFGDAQVEMICMGHLLASCQWIYVLTGGISAQSCECHECEDC